MIPGFKPYTDYELPKLAEKGVKKLFVICPAFVADCLETLEEIGIRARETFTEAGGKEFALIPCMNEHPPLARRPRKDNPRFHQPCSVQNSL